MNRHHRRRAATTRRSLTVHKSGLIGSIAYAQNAASTAIAATTTIAKMMALRLPIAVRCPQSGHLATSWSKSTPQAAHLWSSGCPIDSGSAGIAGGYAERGQGGEPIFPRHRRKVQCGPSCEKYAKPPGRI